MIAATSGASDGQVPAAERRRTRTPYVVTAADMDAALEELRDTRNAMTRVLLGAAPPRGCSARDDDDEDDEDDDD